VVVAWEKMRPWAKGLSWQTQGGRVKPSGIGRIERRSHVGVDRTDPEKVEWLPFSFPGSAMKAVGNGNTEIDVHVKGSS
jgi:hypothetical protein